MTTPPHGTQWFVIVQGDGGEVTEHMADCNFLLGRLRDVPQPVLAHVLTGRLADLDLCMGGPRSGTIAATPGVMRSRPRASMAYGQIPAPHLEFR